MDKSTSNSSTSTNTIRIPKKNIKINRIKRRVLGHVWLVRLGAVLGVLAILYLLVAAGRVVAHKSGLDKYFPLVSGFVFPREENIKSINGRTNIILLGKGDKGHSGGDLTDTIMLVSVSTGSVKAVSIPRDIWIPEIRAKINSAYYWGNEKTPGGGFTMTKSLVEEVTGQPIQYAVMLDFSGFTKIIDLLGGIDIYVENSFVDEKYPIAGRENDTCGGDPQYKCRYETLKFEKGLMHMDGETALKYVRSRYSQSEEGTDLARERRQQKVIGAIKESLFTPKNILNVKQDVEIARAIRSLVETDMEDVTLVTLARLALSIKGGVGSHNIPAELLVNPPESPRFDNQYVFIPKSGNWEEIHGWVKGILAN